MFESTDVRQFSTVRAADESIVRAKRAAFEKMESRARDIEEIPVAERTPKERVFLLEYACAADDLRRAERYLRKS